MLKEIKQRRICRLGNIFFSLSIVSLLAVAGATFLPILWFVAILVLSLFVFYITLFSIGLIWTSEVFFTFVQKAYLLLLTDTLSLMSSIVSYIPMILCIAGGILVATTITLFFDRKRKSSKNKLICILIFLIVFAAFVAYLFINNTFGLGK